MAPTKETPAGEPALLVPEERTFQVRSAGVGRARISDAPGLLTNRAGNSLRLLTGQAPESRVL